MKLDSVGEIIARRRLFLVTNPSKEIYVLIGKPVPFPDSDDYYCPVQITGLGDEKVEYAAGIDSMLAVQLALKRLKAKLSMLNETHDGNLRWEGDDTGGLGFEMSKADRLMIEVVKLNAKRKYKEAISRIDAFLSDDLPTKAQENLYSFRSHTWEEMGDYKRAIIDINKAISLSVERSYSLYVSLVVLGKLLEKTDKSEEAEDCYRRALETATTGQGISSSFALKSFLNITEARELSNEDLELCRNAVIRSWELLKMPGEPETDNLREAAEKIKQEECRPR